MNTNQWKIFPQNTKCRASIEIPFLSSMYDLKPASFRSTPRTQDQTLIPPAGKITSRETKYITEGSTAGLHRGLRLWTLAGSAAHRSSSVAVKLSTPDLTICSWFRSPGRPPRSPCPRAGLGNSTVPTGGISSVAPPEEQHAAIT